MHYIQIRSVNYPEGMVGYVHIDDSCKSRTDGKYDTYEIVDFDEATCFSNDKLVDEIMDIVVADHKNDGDSIIELIPDPFLKIFQGLVDL